MKIKLHEIPVREVVAGYKDSAENGVVGYDGRLNIRPAFQREFIYKDNRDEQNRRKEQPANTVNGNQKSFGQLKGAKTIAR